MVNKRVTQKLYRQYVFGILVLTLLFFTSINIKCKNQTSQHETNSIVSKSQQPLHAIASPSSIEKQDPNNFIIWCYIGSRQTPAVIKEVLKVDFITHILFGVGNRYTSDTLKKNQTQESIRLVHASGKKIILSRFLWPSLPVDHIEADDLFNPKYYINEIRLLKQEAKSIKADFICFDGEPYYKSALNKYFRGPQQLSQKDIERVRKTIQIVIDQVGQVDFIYPAGSIKIRHPYRYVAALGRYRITEHTYYNNKKIVKDINYPYEIPGFYLNTTPVNEVHKHLPYYTVQDLISTLQKNSFKWGVFLYPKEDKALKVAQLLSDFSINHQLYIHK